MKKLYLWGINELRRQSYKKKKKNIYFNQKKNKNICIPINYINYLQICHFHFISNNYAISESFFFFFSRQVLERMTLLELC